TWPGSCPGCLRRPAISWHEHDSDQGPLLPLCAVAVPGTRTAPGPIAPGGDARSAGRDRVDRRSGRFRGAGGGDRDPGPEDPEAPPEQRLLERSPRLGYPPFSGFAAAIPPVTRWVLCLSQDVG